MYLACVIELQSRDTLLISTNKYNPFHFKEYPTWFYFSAFFFSQFSGKTQFYKNTCLLEKSPFFAEDNINWLFLWHNVAFFSTQYQKISLWFCYRNRTVNSFALRYARLMDFFLSLNQQQTNQMTHVKGLFWVKRKSGSDVGLRFFCRKRETLWP